MKALGALATHRASAPEPKACGAPEAPEALNASNPR
jgi:hypothetical protein